MPFDPTFSSAPSVGSKQELTGCDDVHFDADLSMSPGTPLETNAPSGMSFDLSVPQTSDPAAIGESDLKKAVVTLPEGMRVNPSSAAGLTGCAPGEVKLHSLTDASCPPGSKIGTVSIRTPLLDRPVEGSIYLAGPHANPFGTLLSIYVVAEGSGVTIKLPGEVELDQLSGQITTTFDDNPQLPFSNLHLEFKDGARAALANPMACGTYTTQAEFTGWSGAVVATDSSFDITQDGRGLPCPGAKFSPTFRAGIENRWPARAARSTSTSAAPTTISSSEG